MLDPSVARAARPTSSIRPPCSRRPRSRAEIDQERHMPHSKKEKSSEKPSVSTFADHEIIHPPNKLRKALKTVSEKEAAEDPVANAENALAQLSSAFSGWMDAECERLDAARREINTKGFTKATREALFLAAHDIKGQ